MCDHCGEKREREQDKQSLSCGWRDCLDHQSRMFVLIWVTLLFNVRSDTANTVAPPGETEHCQNGLCVTPSEAEITVEAGLCVVIPCAVWYKCDPSKLKNCTDSDIILHLNNTNPKAQSGLRRVSLLEPDLSQRNCSIIINDLKISDSGSYQLRVNVILNGTTKEYTSHRATITVKDQSWKPTVMIPPLAEGQQTTLTCTAPGLCSGSDPKITWTWKGKGENDSHITGNITANQGQSSTLTFDSSVIHHGTEVTCKVSFTGGTTTEETVTLNVTYVKKPGITGKTTIKQGDALNLTCSVDSFPPSVITWTKLGLNKNLNSETETDLHNDTGTATLVIPNMTAEYSGQYLCTAKHLNNTLTEEVNITVILYPKILNSSRCINQSEVLTCMCISEGFPLPTIKWPLLKNHTEFSGITIVSNHTVNSTVILTVKDHSNTVVECVSTNKNGEVKGNLIINKAEEEGQAMKLLRIATQLEVIIAFFIGALISATVCCLARKCHRKKKRTYGNLALEMVTSHEDSLIDAGQAVENDQAMDQEAAEGGGAVAAGQSDVEYSNLDFSLMKRQNAADAGTTQGSTETEYAEIKREKAEARQDGEGKEEEEMIGEDEKTKHCVPDEKEGEDVALYSNVKDIM